MSKRTDGYPDYYVFMGHGKWLPTEVKKKLVEFISNEEKLKRVPVVGQDSIPLKARRAIILNQLNGESHILYLKKYRSGEYIVYLPVKNNKSKIAVLRLY